MLVDEFVEVLKTNYGVSDVFVDEFNAVSLKLEGELYFYFEVGATASVIMLFLLRLPAVMTEAEIYAANEIVQSQRDGVVGGVAQLPDCELVYFNMIEDEVGVELLLDVLSGMVERWKDVVVCVDVVNY
ncbi:MULTISPECIES: hypothetical protein [Pseudomonas]|uniref:hypothetical protein n=1 Tax=Pseudomonas TaxID=286 RepID=UPI0011157DFF|nr:MULTISPECIES: hypothetical protein [Pseudomonas]